MILLYFRKNNEQVTIRHGKNGELSIFDTGYGFGSSIACYKCGLLTFCKASIADKQSKNSLFIPLENDSVCFIQYYNSDWTS